MKMKLARCQWLTSIILATQKTENTRLMVQSQPGQIACKTLEKPHHKRRAGGVAQGVCPKFKPQYLKKKSDNKRDNTSRDQTEVPEWGRNKENRG
jgi:hypothetical protein